MFVCACGMQDLGRIEPVRINLLYGTLFYTAVRHPRALVDSQESIPKIRREVELSSKLVFASCV